MSIPEKIAPIDLFNYLRNEESFHLTQEDYIVFLDAVCKGLIFSIYPDHDYNNAVKELTKALWVKSIDHAKEYDKIFNKFMSKNDFLSKADSEQNEKEDTHTGNGQDDNNPPGVVSGVKDLYKRSSYLIFRKNEKKEKKGSKITQGQSSDKTTSHKIDFENYENPPDDYNKDLYFPASSNVISNCFSKLVKHPKKKFNIEATIQKMIDNGGKLIEYVHSENKIKRPRKICIMVDQSRSMRPFRVYTNRLVDVAKQVNGVTDNDIVYFDNTPDKWIYIDKFLRKEHYLKQFLHDNSGAKIIIISDAGYARGDDNEYRLKMTRLFYDQLKAFYIKAIWINPLPRSRWFSIGYVQIDEIVSMFDMSESNLEKAVCFLNEE